MSGPQASSVSVIIRHLPSRFRNTNTLLLCSPAQTYTLLHTRIPAYLYTPTHHLHTYTPTPSCVIRALQQMKHRPGTRLKTQKKKKGETEVRCLALGVCTTGSVVVERWALLPHNAARGSFHTTHNTHITTTHTPQHHTTHNTQTCARAHNTHSHPSLLGEVPRRAGGACEERVALYRREPHPGMGRGIAGEGQ